MLFLFKMTNSITLSNSIEIILNNMFIFQIVLKYYAHGKRLYRINIMHQLLKLG